VGFCPGPEQLAGLSARTVAEAARGGDPLAVEILRTSGRYLGRGLALLVDVLNPEVIVIGSIFARAGELLWPAAREELEREALGPALRACRVVPAALGERIGDYAAVSVALEAAKEGT
jgi:glucokinase